MVRRGKYEQERNSLVAICDQCSEYKTYPQDIFLGVHKFIIQLVGWKIDKHVLSL